MSSLPTGTKLLAENRRARFDYDFLETFEAGLELLGGEVKSVKSGQAALSGSYALVRGGECFLINAQIPPYQAGNTKNNYEPDRTRKLLLKKEEIKNLSGRLAQKGFSLIPVTFYAKRGLIKVQLALAKSRKAHDKRELLKKRAHDREMARRD